MENEVNTKGYIIEDYVDLNRKANEESREILKCILEVLDDLNATLNSMIEDGVSTYEKRN